MLFIASAGKQQRILSNVYFLCLKTGNENENRTLITHSVRMNYFDPDCALYHQFGGNRVYLFT